MARSLRSLRQVATMRHGHMARRSALLLHLGHWGYMSIFGHLVYGTFGRHYCRQNGLKFLSPKWLVTKRPCPNFFLLFFFSNFCDIRYHGSLSSIKCHEKHNQISCIFVINQVPCVSSCWGEKTHTRGLQRK